jgi:hypothetical protein
MGSQMRSGDILVILPKKLPGRQTAKIRAMVQRLSEATKKEETGDRIEYRKVLAINNNALGFWVAMDTIKDLGGVEKVETFIAGRRVSDEELLETHRQMLKALKLGGRIPKNLSERLKGRMRGEPGLSV